MKSLLQFISLPPWIRWSVDVFIHTLFTEKVIVRLRDDVDVRWRLMWTSSLRWSRPVTVWLKNQTSWPSYDSLPHIWKVFRVSVFICVLVTQEFWMRGGNVTYVHNIMRWACPYESQALVGLVERHSYEVARASGIIVKLLGEVTNSGSTL